THHVLPSYGLTNSHYCLGFSDFSNSLTVHVLFKEGFLALGKIVDILAQNEDLDAHNNAVTFRLVSLKCVK
ncbi:histidinol dehydrogenase, partial [Campylobacter jejuni]|uniref:histidinol dehydrogenase n=1 Tax=Campylobacter jejuni TaxID=197 RepID=UPI001F0920AF